MTLVAPAARSRVLGALFEGISQGAGFAMCFEPHHALVATHEGRRYEVLICYACSQVQVWQGDTSLGGASIGHAGSAVLNEVLGQDGNIPSGEARGRPLAHWVERFRAGLGKPTSGAFEDAAEVIADLPASQPLRSQALATVVDCLRAYYAHDPLEVRASLERAIRNRRSPEVLRAAIALVASSGASALRTPTWLSAGAPWATSCWRSCAARCPSPSPGGRSSRRAGSR